MYNNYRMIIPSFGGYCNMHCGQGLRWGIGGFANAHHTLIKNHKLLT